MTTRQHRPETGWIAVRANGLEFACFAEGSGPLVLLLHGFPDTARTWDDLRPRIAIAGYRVVAPFMRGYAPTEIPRAGGYDAETLGRDVVALVDALADGSRAVVVGHDWGAVAAYAAATLAPQKVAKLVTIAIPHPATLRPTPTKLWGVRHFVGLRLPDAATRFARDDFAQVEVLYRRWSPNWSPLASELEPVKNAFAAPGSLDAALGYYRAAGLVVPKFLRRAIQVPALVFGGTCDGVAEESDFRHGAKLFENGYEVAMTPGGHFLHRETPEPFLERLLAFLRA